MRDFCGEQKRMRFEKMQIAVPKKANQKNAAIRIKKSFELSGGFLGDKAVCY